MNAVKTGKDFAKVGPGVPAKSGMSTFDIVLIVIGVACVAALVAYQIYGCAGCYAGLQG